jgi:hypothetical protein
MVVGFITTCVISAYHQQCCEFELVKDKAYSIQHYVINFVSDLRQVSGYHISVILNNTFTLYFNIMCLSVEIPARLTQRVLFNDVTIVIQQGVSTA